VTLPDDAARWSGIGQLDAKNLCYDRICFLQQANKVKALSCLFGEFMELVGGKRMWLQRGGGLILTKRVIVMYTLNRFSGGCVGNMDSK
jgi:hypothetical protein